MRDIHSSIALPYTKVLQKALKGCQKTEGLHLTVLHKTLQKALAQETVHGDNPR